MSIPATCPVCNASYQLVDKLSGKRVRCKSCSQAFVVPVMPAAPDSDEDEVRIQTSPRPASHVDWDEEDEDRGWPPLGQRPLKKHSNAALPLLIVACIVLGLLILGPVGVAVWALTRARQPQPAPAAVGFNPPAAVPQPAQVPEPQPMAPPVHNPIPANGPLVAVLSNANITGFGAQIEVTADYRFTSGNPAGRRIFLFIKATKAMGFLQKANHYTAELHSIGNRTQGTIKASGMTFGLEDGPFELWLGEGPAGFGPLIVANDLRQISNVVTVASKQFGIPGLPKLPGMGPPAGMPGIPGRRPPFGPRGMRP